MVSQARILHDGLDVAVLPGRLLSVAFDELEGHRTPTVTHTAGAAPTTSP